MTLDMNAAVGGYEPLVAAIAERWATYPSMERVGAEYDDLRQEGLIHVWQQLAAGKLPMDAAKLDQAGREKLEGHLVNRMKDWRRTLAKQRGGYLTEIVPLDMLTDEELRALADDEGA